MDKETPETNNDNTKKNDEFAIHQEAMLDYNTRLLEIARAMSGLQYFIDTTSYK